MSRYHIPHDTFDIWVGWSPAMGSFFAQVWLTDDDLGDEPILWIGTKPSEIRSLEVLRRHLCPYTHIPADIAFILNVDFATAEPHTALQDLLDRIEASSAMQGSLETVAS